MFRGPRMPPATVGAAMGEIVNVVERRSTRPGIVRFETNRVLSGTGHDRYTVDHAVEGNRTVDELARRLFARGGIDAVHINSSVVTVDLADGADTDGLAEIIRGLYTFYEDAVPLPAAEVDTEVETEVETEASDEAAAEQARAQVPEGHAEQAAEPVITEEPAGEA
jgi:hypothetical protein